MTADTIPDTPETILSVESLSLSIASRNLFSNLSFMLTAGQSLGVLGRNGTGKTSLLHAILGLRTVDRGYISIGERDIRDWPRKQLAMKTGILLQNSEDEMPATVLEMALMGRYPHSAAWRRENAEDLAQAQQALDLMDLEMLVDRQLSTLSGGERQRLALAVLLAQAPQLYLLDEPSNHLDIGFQIRALDVLTQRLGAQGSALCMATHDINLAARFCRDILLFMGDGRFIYGPAHSVLSEENLSIAYACSIRRLESGQHLVFYPG